MKNKAVRITVKSFAVLLAAVVLFALFLFLYGTHMPAKHTADEYLSEWMKDIPDTALLRKTAIPGSHDAGTNGMLWPFRTQDSSIKDQLGYGCRYFDIRVNKTSTGYPIFHSFANGTDFRNILPDIKDFIETHPTEILLLDFQHFKGDSRNDVIDMLDSSLASAGLVLRNMGDKTDVEFMNTLTVGEARGKCIVFIGGIDEEDTDWIFTRNNDDCTKENTALDSFYVTEYHTEGFDVLTEKGHPVYFDSNDRKEKENTAGIFVLQCQLTDGKMIFGPWSEERRMEMKMNEYVLALTESEKAGQINVIMRDFVTPEKCLDIIGLNK